MVIRLITKAKERAAKLMDKQEEAAAEEPAPAGPTQEELLTEIRDLLKAKAE